MAGRRHCRIWGLGFNFWGLGGFQVKGSFGVWGFGFRVEGLEGHLGVSFGSTQN